MGSTVRSTGCYNHDTKAVLQSVDSVEVQGSHGQGHHGCVGPQGPEEGHCVAEHSESFFLIMTACFQQPVHLTVMLFFCPHLVSCQGYDSLCGAVSPQRPEEGQGSAEHGAAFCLMLSVCLRQP